MSIAYQIQSGSAEACGPGTRLPLVTPGFTLGEVDLSLDATGDTANREDNANSAGQLYDAGTWALDLYFKNTGFGTSSLSIPLAQYTSACGLVRLLATGLTVFQGSSYALFSYSTDHPPIHFGNGDILRLVVRKTAGQNAWMRYNEASDPRSLVTTPDVRAYRPHAYYQRQRRRRSC